MLTEEEFASNCCIPAYGRRLYEEMRKLIKENVKVTKVVPRAKPGIFLIFLIDIT
jgi:hypothetical protein